MNSKLNFFLAIVLVAGTSAAFAQSASQAQHDMGAAGAAASMVMTSGEVRKVDLDQGKVTLKHDAITNLDMPPMTMVFRVASADQLKGLKPGDKVAFHAESSGGALIVTHIQALQ